MMMSPTKKKIKEKDCRSSKKSGFIQKMCYIKVILQKVQYFSKFEGERCYVIFR